MTGFFLAMIVLTIINCTAGYIIYTRIEFYKLINKKMEKRQRKMIEFYSEYKEWYENKLPELSEQEKESFERFKKEMINNKS